MFDFRYHALSLVAVLVALVIGLLLGIAIGDTQLVSSAAKDLKQNLENRVLEAHAESARLSAQLAQRDDYEKRTLTTLVHGELAGRRVGVVFVHDGDRQGLPDVTQAVRQAGGDLAFVATLRVPPDLRALAATGDGLRYARLPVDPSLLEPFATRQGEALRGSGRLAQGVRHAMFSSFSGQVGKVDALVVSRRAPDAQRPEEADVEERFVRGLFGGFTAAGLPVAGVERTDTDPSQVRWYRSHGMSSIDDLDLAAGQAALVFALAGQADGAYGVKPTRDALLPDALTAPSG